MAQVKSPATSAVSRRDRARATRLRMTRAAHELFVARGYAGARMADIADAAGVAVQTLYFTFHTKAELLQACYELAVLGEDEPLPPPNQPWYAAMLRAKSGRVALQHFAVGNSSIVARVGVLDDVIRSAAHEPDAAAVRQHSEQLRRDGYRDVIEYLDSRFNLRAGLDVAAATDLLLAFGGTALYRSLVVDYGWPHERYVDWLAATLGDQLLPTRSKPRRAT
jgi:AcrR family transcriptional regulator